MERLIHCAALVIALSLAPSNVQAQQPQRPYTRGATWYEFLLKQFNPRDVDYGARLEKRRQALLAATIRAPHFWYTLSATAATLIVLLAYTKLYLDHRRSMRITSEIMTDIYMHDLFSRQTAAEAIARYNAHIEQCNRAIEATESGDARPGWRDTAADNLKAELQRVSTELDLTMRDRNKLREELRQKELIVADLSRRIDNLTRKANGDRGSQSAATSTVGDENGDGMKFVGQINRLQEALYAERQKNKRLKGA
jgi:hypothetical protein